MYGVWLAGFMKPQPITITISTIETLVTTMMLLTVADSCVPRISSADSTSRMTTAGTFMIPVTPFGALERRVAPLVRHVHADELQHLVEVLAPGDRHRRRADRILETPDPSR